MGKYILGNEKKCGYFDKDKNLSMKKGLPERKIDDLP